MANDFLTFCCLRSSDCSPFVRKRVALEAQSAALEHLRSHIGYRLKDIRSQRNAIAPINGLPTELTVAILSRSVASDDGAFGHRYSLAKVQTRWWRIIRNNGCFWNTISSLSPLSEVAFSLQRSGDTPLHIDIGEYTDHDNLGPFMRLVARHTGRWKTFSYSEGDFDILKPYLEVPMPLLESLHVSDQNADASDPPFLNFFGVPKLSELSAWGIVISFSKGVFPSLTTLDLDYMPADAVTSQNMLNTLGSCPRLESLSLCNTFHGEHHPAIDSIEPTVLPHLTKLTLAHVCANTTLLFLRAIRFVPGLELLLDCGEGEGDRVLDVFRHLIKPHGDQASILSTVLSRTHIHGIRFTLSDRAIGIQGQLMDTTSVVRIDLKANHYWPSILNDHLHLLPFSSAGLRIPITLDYQVHSGGNGDGRLAGPLLVELLPTVASVIFDCGLKEASSVIQRLKTVKENGVWNWPELNTIQFSGRLGRQLPPERWNTFLHEVDDLVNLRNNLEGASVSARNIRRLVLGLANDGRYVRSLCPSTIMRG